VYVGELVCWNRDGVERNCRLLVDLPPLALLAVSAKSCHILANTLTHKTCRHPRFGGTYARAGHTVNGMLDGSSVRQQHQWLGDPMRHVYSRLAPSTRTVLTVRKED
jgi:hypothetical protein